MAATMSPQERQTPLQKALDKAFAEYTKACDATSQLGDDKRALMNKRQQLGDTLAREGKLTREQRAELNRVNRDLRALDTPLKRAVAREQRAREKHDQATQRLRAQQARVAERDQQRRSAKARQRVARHEAKSQRQANYARLPEGSKPSKAIGDGDRLPSGAMLEKVGRGKGAHWVLVATDSYQLVTVQLEVSNDKAVRRAFIPGEALKAIEKAGAFRINPSGAIQPLKVAVRSYGVRDGDLFVTRRDWVAEKVGQPVFTTIDPKEVRFPTWEKVVPKQPAKVNSLQVRVDPRVLARAADALGAKQGITLTIDLSKAGKASKGRRCQSAILVGSNGQPEGVVMPVRLPEAS